MMGGIWIVAFYGTFVCFASNVMAGKLQTERLKVERSLCVTQECKELAKLMIDSMNRTVDPCEDFYEYACGNWAQHNPLPKDQIHWNLFYKLQKLVHSRLEAIAAEGPKAKDYHAIKVAKQAFNACLDTEKIEKEGLQPLISTMWRAGGWPLIMYEAEWNEEMYRWQSIDDYYALLTGGNAFHDTGIGINRQYSGEDMYDMKFLQIRTPHLPEGIYGIYTEEPKDLDSSDENNDSGEDSQERGSNEGSGEYSGDGSGDDTEDDEDEYEIQKRRRVSNPVSRNRRQRRSKDLGAVKRTGRKSMKTKKREDRIKISNKKHSKLGTNKKADQNMKKLAKKSFLVSKGRSENSAGKNTQLSSGKSKDQDIDLYFEEDKNENGNVIDTGRNEEDTDRIQYVDNKLELDKRVEGSGGDDNDGSGEGSGDDDDDGSGEGSGDDDEDDDKNNEYDDRRNKKEARKYAGEKRKKYAEYIFNVSRALSKARGVPISKKELMKDIDELIQFQVDLLKATIKYGERTNETLNKFQSRYQKMPRTRNSKVNWVRKVQDLFSYGGMEIDGDHHVSVPNNKYFKKLVALLDSTPSRTIVNYLHWRFLSEIIKGSTKEMRGFYYKWSDKVVKDDQRTFFCLYEVQVNHMLGYEYVKRYFPEKALQSAFDMMDDIEKQVEHEIKKSTWMDDETREIILDKLMFMKKSIGYPDSYRNDTAMKEYLTGLSVGNSHLENLLSIMRYDKLERLKRLFKEGSFFSDMNMDPLMVNAFFSPFENTLEVTAADFQKPFFDFKQPWYTNYGIMGLIMSHEVNHGFDVIGRRFDKHGSRGLRWSPEMEIAYLTRAKCFMDQFTKYSLDNKTANLPIPDYGQRTAPENIADTMGLEAVFRAYQRRERTCETPDPMLPGLEHLSNEQLLFLSFAYLWCEVSDTEKYHKLLQKDSHSSGPLRVIGAVSNSDDFAKAYNCPLGSPMNPKKKCNIWN